MEVNESMTRYRPHRICGAALALAILLGCCGAASAQVVVMVNGAPITAFDIEQRGKLKQLSDHKVPPRQEIIDELIDEKLKVQVAKKYNLEISASDVDQSFAAMAQRVRLTPQQFIHQLAASGLRPDTLKARIKADLTWTQLIRGRFGQSLQLRDKDVDAIVGRRSEEKGKEDVGLEYSLTPILFVVPRGSGESVVEARKREADGLRARFEGCGEGIPFARALRDVAVRDPITRMSADLAPALRDILNNTAVGKLTAPEVTAQGVEMYALCAKKETTADTPGKRAVREEFYSERFQEHSKKYLKELRSTAMIEYRQQ
jgi:peptidyl-prolyl cis-trans isomerase SurA